MIEKEQLLKPHLFRHACKIFDKDKKIPAREFETILEVGRLSPSSFGFEPWKFLVVQDMQKREKLKKITWGALNILPTASHFVMILARKKSLRYDSEYITHIMKDIHHLSDDATDARRAKYKEFQENDFDLLSDDRYLFDWACKQTYIAQANMLTTAAMMGIDSCPIEGFKAKEMSKLLESEFGIDSKEFGVSVMIGFGYRIKEPREKTRQKLEDIVEWL